MECLNASAHAPLMRLFVGHRVAKGDQGWKPAAGAAGMTALHVHQHMQGRAAVALVDTSLALMR
jgi:hypothetical protein